MNALPGHKAKSKVSVRRNCRTLLAQDDRSEDGDDFRDALTGREQFSIGQGGVVHDGGHTICATRVATDDAGAAFDVSAREAMLADDLYRFSRLLPRQALGAVVNHVFAGMNRRYAEHLGVTVERVEQEHRALVQAGGVRSGVTQA